MMRWGSWRGCFVIGVSGRRIGGKSGGGLEGDGSDWERGGTGNVTLDGCMNHKSRCIRLIGGTI